MSFHNLSATSVLIALALVPRLNHAQGVAQDPAPDPSTAIAIAQANPNDHTDADPAVGLGNSRLVVFRYDDNRSFAVRALTGAFVNVELPDGETVQGYYPSDAIAFESHVTGDKRRIMIKPLEAGKIATATVVSNKRSYEITVISVTAGWQWFQRVRWDVPEPSDLTAWAGQDVSMAVQDKATADADPLLIDPDRLHANYRVRGNEDFTPTVVFDDSTRTWIRFGRVQDWPAVFAQTKDGLELLTYSVVGETLVIPSVHDMLVLRLGKRKVTLERR